MTTVAGPRGGVPPLPLDSLHEIMRHVESGLQRVVDATNALVDRTNFVLTTVPPAVGDGLRRTTEWLVTLIDDAVHRVSELVADAGNSDALRAVGETWRIEIGRRVGELANELEDDDVRVAAHWSGAAADGYRDAVRRQATVLASVEAAAAALGAELGALADAVVVFWIELAGAVLLLAAGIVCATALLSSARSAPAALAAAAAETGAFATSAAAASGRLGTQTHQVAERLARLEHDLLGHP